MPRGKRIAPCLWFDDQAEQAAAFYTLDLQELEDHQDDAIR